MTKRANYYYDAEAICEPVIGIHESVNRNARNVWTINTQPFKGAHFATMPSELAEKCIKAGTSEKGYCPRCGIPWVRTFKRIATKEYNYLTVGIPNEGEQRGRRDVSLGTSQYKPVGWKQSCKCPPLKPIFGRVLDPFGGSGTTAMVANKLNRDAVLIELNPKYIDIIHRRLKKFDKIPGALFSKIPVK